MSIDSVAIRENLIKIIDAYDVYLTHLQTECIAELAKRDLKAEVVDGRTPKHPSEFKIYSKDGLKYDLVKNADLSYYLPNFEPIIFKKIAAVTTLCADIIRRRDDIVSGSMLAGDLAMLEDNISALRDKLGDDVERMQIYQARVSETAPVDTQGGKFLAKLDRVLPAIEYAYADTENKLIETFRTNIITTCTRFEEYLSGKSDHDVDIRKKNHVSELSKKLETIAEAAGTNGENIEVTAKHAKDAIAAKSTALHAHRNFLTYFKLRTEAHNVVTLLNDAVDSLLNRAKALTIDIKRPAPNRSKLK